MGEYVVKLPDVGEGIAEAEIVEWHVNVGDTVDEDALLVDVMTDKATVELPTPVAGTVTRLAGEAGDVVAIGSDLVWIDTDADAGRDTGRGGDAGTDADAGTDTDADDGTDTDAGGEAVEERPDVSSFEPDELTADVVPAAADGETNEQRQPDRSRERDEASSSPARGALAAPAVRRRAAALGIDLTEIDGTGPDGRVVHEDLDRHIVDRSSAAPATAPAARSAPAPARDTEADEIDAVKVIGLRRNIAKRMQEATRRIAHFTYVDEVDVTDLERLRAELNGRDDGRPRLSILPFLMRAVVVAVADHPQLNARYKDDDGVIERHRAVHLGIATQTPKGLMVPVVANAHAADLWTLAAEVTRVANAARDGSIGLDELQGSSITITSLGALGGIVTTPVINHPEVAIIGVNKIVVRPLWSDGSWLPRSMMNLSSSFDHRVIDGWDAAQFIQRVRQLLETPALLFVE